MDVLQQENEHLKKEIRTLVVEKTRIVDQLYRAFRKVLNSKKRKINELQQEIEKMKTNNDGGKRSKVQLQRILNSSSDGEEEEEDEKMEEDSDETDIDINDQDTDLEVESSPQSLKKSQERSPSPSLIESSGSTTTDDTTGLSLDVPDDDINDEPLESETAGSPSATAPTSMPIVPVPVCVKQDNDSPDTTDTPPPPKSYTQQKPQSKRKIRL